MTHRYDWYQEWGLSDERRDLNDPETYSNSWFPKKFLAFSAEQLRDEIRRQLQYALYYMTIWNPGFDKDQHSRIEHFARHFEREVKEPDRWTNKQWLLKRLFMIRDQTSNLC